MATRSHRGCETDLGLSRFEAVMMRFSFAEPTFLSARPGSIILLVDSGDLADDLYPLTLKSP